MSAIFGQLLALGMIGGFVTAVIGVLTFLVPDGARMRGCILFAIGAAVFSGSLWQVLR